MANRHPRKRRRQPRAPRRRRLLIEQFEPRTLLASAAPDGADVTINTLEDTPYVFQASDSPGNAMPLATLANDSSANPADTVSQPAIYTDLLNMLAADAASAQLKRRRLAN